MPSGRIVDILNGKRAISAETALRLGRYFGNDPRFWINLQAQYELALAMRARGARSRDGGISTWVLVIQEGSNGLNTSAPSPATSERLRVASVIR